MKGLALILRPKGGKAPDDEPAAPEEDAEGSGDEGAMREAASLAFRALKDDDEEGFVDALVTCCRACMRAEM